MTLKLQLLLTLVIDSVAESNRDSRTSPFLKDKIKVH